MMWSLSGRSTPLQPGIITRALKSPSLLLASLLLPVYFALRIQRLNESLWIHEVFSYWANTRTWEAFVLTLRQDGHPPLHTIFNFFWRQLAGGSELLARVPSVVTSLSLLYLIYFRTTRYVSTSTRSVAALLLILSPIDIWFSTEVRAYGPVMCLLFMSTLLTVETLEQADVPKRTRWLLYGALTCTSLLHYYTLPAIAVIGICAAAKGVRRHRGILISCFIVAAVTAGLIAFRGTSVQGASHLRPFNSHELWKLIFDFFFFGASLDLGDSQSLFERVLQRNHRLDIFLLHLAALLFFVRGTYLSIKDFCLSMSMFSLFVVLVPTGCIVAVYLFSTIVVANSYTERSLAMLLPFFALVVGRGAGDFKAVPVRFLSLTCLSVLALYVLINVFSRRDHFTVNAPRSDWRSAFEYIDATTASARKPVVISASNYGIRIAEFYHRFIFSGANRPPVYTVMHSDIRTDTKSMCNLNAHHYFYVVDTFALPPEDVGSLRRLMSSGPLHLVSVEQMRGIKIFRFVPFLLSRCIGANR